MIIFTPSRSEAARVGTDLNSLAESLARLDGSEVEPLQVVTYHAGLDNRAATEQLFVSTTGIVVVATIEFGMSVHCAHVRAVLHFCTCCTCPTSDIHLLPRTRDSITDSRPHPSVCQR